MAVTPIANEGNHETKAPFFAPSSAPNKNLIVAKHRVAPFFGPVRETRSVNMRRVHKLTYNVYGAAPTRHVQPRVLPRAQCVMALDGLTWTSRCGLASLLVSLQPQAFGKADRQHLLLLDVFGVQASRRSVSHPKFAAPMSLNTYATGRSPNTFRYITNSN